MKIELNKKEILEYQNNEPPYLMIDFASEIIPGKKADGYKILNEDEWFFKVHWKNDPNMPGMLQIEALSQMAALRLACEIKSCKVSSENVRFSCRAPACFAWPGTRVKDRLEMLERSSHA